MVLYDKWKLIRIYKQSVRAMHPAGFHIASLMHVVVLTASRRTVGRRAGREASRENETTNGRGHYKRDCSY